MRDMIDEQWRPIEGYEGYEVSNLGKVRSFDSYDRLGRLNKKGRILKPGMNKFGYLQVELYKEGKRNWFLVHRLVGTAFIPNPEGLPQINHKNEIKTDNRIENLEWCDNRYNMNYGTRNEREIQTKITKGIYDPELCGLDEKERQRMYMRKYRLKKKQEKKKDNRPSEISLW